MKLPWKRIGIWVAKRLGEVAKRELVEALAGEAEKPVRKPRQRLRQRP